MPSNVEIVIYKLRPEEQRHFFKLLTFSMTIFSFLTDVNSTFNATVIALSCFVFLSLVVNAVLIWRLRRAVSNNRTMTTDKTIIHDIGKPDLPRDQHVSVPDSYMELRPRPSEGHSLSPPDFKSAHDTNKSPGYYNLGLNKGNDGNDNEETYEEIMNDYVYPKIM